MNCTVLQYFAYFLSNCNRFYFNYSACNFLLVLNLIALMYYTILQFSAYNYLLALILTALILLQELLQYSVILF